MVMLLSVGLLSSCTLFNLEREPCTQNSDCTASFGEGSICETDNDDPQMGYCSICETNSDCIDAYGNGATCQTREDRTSVVELTEPKYCEIDLEPHVRCETSFPPNIWEDWDTYKNAIIIGQLFRGDTDLSKITATQLALEQVQRVQADNEDPFVSVLCDYSQTDDFANFDDLEESDAIKLVSSHLADDFGADVIIGPPSSKASLTAIDHLDGRAVLISPSATSAGLSNIQVDQGEDTELSMFWRTVASDDNQSEVLISLIIQKEQEASEADSERSTKIGVVYTDQVYGLGIADSIRAELGSEVVKEFKFDKDTTDSALESVLIGTENTAFEGVTSIVFAISDVDKLVQAFDIILDYNADNDDSRIYFFTDSAARSEVFDPDIRAKITANPDITNQIWGTRPAILEDGPFSDFNADFELLFTEASGETYDPASTYKYSAENNVFAAYSYDAMWLGILGSLWAKDMGENTAEGVSAGLQTQMFAEQQANSGDIPAPTPLRATEWSYFKTASKEQKQVNVQGCSGELDFRPMSREVDPKIEIWMIDENSKQIEFDECFWEEEELKCPVLLPEETE